jgi:hypothetical protein
MPITQKVNTLIVRPTPSIWYRPSSVKWTIDQDIGLRKDLLPLHTALQSLAPVSAVKHDGETLPSLTQQFHQLQQSRHLLKGFTTTDGDAIDICISKNAVGQLGNRHGFAIMHVMTVGHQTPRTTDIAALHPNTGPQSGAETTNVWFEMIEP